MTLCPMPWILFLVPFTESAHSVRIKTDTTLDQDCVLKATVQVCTACMAVRKKKKSKKKKKGLQEVRPETAQNIDLLIGNVTRNRVCRVSALCPSAQLFTLEPDNGLCAHTDVTSRDVTSATTQSSSVQVQCSADGHAQTLLLLRVANLFSPANTMHFWQVQEVSVQHFQKQPARLKPAAP